MATRCMIVDDEPLATELLQSYIKKIESLEVAASCTNAIEAFEMLQSVHVDLLFVDIQMPQLSGIEFLKTLVNPPAIIITTAYRQYAYDGFELNILDYLLKPITFERFLRSVNKYHERYSSVPAGSPATQPDKTSAFLMVKDGNVMKKVLLDEILFIEAYGEFVKFHLNNKILIAGGPFRLYEEKLPGAGFFRIHKSYIVSLSKVDLLTTGFVNIGKVRLPVSRTYRNSIMRRFGNLK